MSRTTQQPFSVGIWGFSDSGKTRLIEQLIPALKARALRVGTVKHASHEVALDMPGKDSHRHAEAGAERVLLLGPGSATLFIHANAESELKAWMGQFAGQVDVLLVEGFKRTEIPHVQIEQQDVPDFEMSSSRQDGRPAKR